MGWMLLWGRAMSPAKPGHVLDIGAPGTLRLYNITYVLMNYDLCTILRLYLQCRSTQFGMKTLKSDYDFWKLAIFCFGPKYYYASVLLSQSFRLIWHIFPEVGGKGSAFRCLLFTLFFFIHLGAWFSGNIVGCINEVTVCRARFVLRWVTVCWCTILLCNQATHVNSAWPSIRR